MPVHNRSKCTVHVQYIPPARCIPWRISLIRRVLSRGFDVSPLSFMLSTRPGCSCGARHHDAVGHSRKGVIGNAAPARLASAAGVTPLGRLMCRDEGHRACYPPCEPSYDREVLHPGSRAGLVGRPDRPDTILFTLSTHTPRARPKGYEPPWWFSPRSHGGCSPSVAVQLAVADKAVQATPPLHAALAGGAPTNETR